MKKLHLVVCLFCFLSALWLGAMELQLRHPGYPLQLVTAAIIAGQSAAAGAGIGRLRWSLLPGAVLVLAIGAAAVKRGAEGYTGAIGLACVLQAALTLAIVSAGIAERLRHRRADRNLRT